MRAIYIYIYINFIGIQWRSPPTRQSTLEIIIISPNPDKNFPSADETTRLFSAFSEMAKTIKWGNGRVWHRISSVARFRRHDRKSAIISLRSFGLKCLTAAVDRQERNIMLLKVSV